MQTGLNLSGLVSSLFLYIGAGNPICQTLGYLPYLPTTFHTAVTSLLIISCSAFSISLWSPSRPDALFLFDFLIQSSTFPSNKSGTVNFFNCYGSWFWSWYNPVNSVKSPGFTFSTTELFKSLNFLALFLSRFIA